MTREEAIEFGKMWLELQEDCKESNTYEFFKIAIEALQKEPRKGHWKVVSDGYSDNAYICECSECKDTVWVYKDADRKWNFCPNCGADMREVKE